ncbi:MAG: FKBP-type peptidyl-prolyl cis-trans isomerase [Candidatus Bathyarchaeia archaeon]
MNVQRGDFILLDYSMKVKETGELFDTTKEEEAKEAKIYRQGTFYEPILVVVGAGWILKGLDESLVGMEEGKPFTIEIPPERGLGPRDPNKIKLFPIRRFRELDRRLQPGMQVEVNGQVATVRSIGAGRVQLDFNPPLAGKTIVFNGVVRKILSDPLEKIRHLIHRRIPSISKDKFGFEGLEGGILKITIPEEAFLIEGLQIIKRGIASDIERFFPDIKEVIFMERYERKTPPQTPSTPIAVPPTIQAPQAPKSSEEVEKTHAAEGGLKGQEERKASETRP